MDEPSVSPSSKNFKKSPPTIYKAYPWLLGISTCLSALFCWMYVTKPVIQTSELPKNERKEVLQSQEEPTSQNSSQKVVKKSANPKNVRSLLPGNDGLPGMKTSNGKSVAKSSLHDNKPVDPRQLLDSGDGTGWETSNSRIQHILRAETSTGEVKKIVLNVPVLYQSRTMRWTPEDVQKARSILTRLLVYEKNLADIRREGDMLLSDWNRLLAKTVPAKVLRADSPSLPYNHTPMEGVGRLPESKNTIKIEQ